jgi:hypothetical protein
MLVACDMGEVLDIKLSRDIGTKDNGGIWPWSNKTGASMKKSKEEVIYV